MSEFGQCFRMFLDERNLSQTQVGKLLGMTQQTVHYYCTVKNPPRPHILAHMSASLGVTVDELLGKPAPAIVRESSPPYSASSEIPNVQSQMLDLRRRWKKARPEDRAGIELAVRTLWGDRAEEILTWISKSERGK